VQALQTKLSEYQQKIAVALKIDNDKNEAVEEMANRKGQIHKHIAEIGTTNSTTYSKATSS
jgi:type III secretion system FlhB-like substrate exporter